MDYTQLTLFGMGMLGILTHNLIKMDSINRKSKGELNFTHYLRIERFSILISVCVVGIALVAKHEIKQLESVGKILGLAFVAIGYMAQSILVSYMGRAENFLDVNEKKVDNDL